MIFFADVVVCTARIRIRLDFINAVLRSIHVIGAIHPALRRISSIGIQTGIHIQNMTDSLLCAAGAVVPVILNDIIPVQRFQIPNHAANIASRGMNTARKAIVSDVTNAIVPALFHHRLSAQNAPNIVCTCNSRAALAAFNTHTGGIGCRTDVVAAADYSARIIAGSGDGTGKNGVAHVARSHRLTFSPDKTSYIVLAVHIGSACTVGYVSVYRAAKGANVALALVIANGYTGFHHTVHETDRIDAGGVSANESRG